MEANIIIQNFHELKEITATTTLSSICLLESLIKIISFIATIK